MTQLTVTHGPTAGTKVTLSANRSCLIGSSPDAALPVAGEGIAARHLLVKALKAGGFGVKGLAGAFKLNGRAVDAAKLNDGDRIVIGDVEILYGKVGVEGSRQLGGFRLISPLGKGGMGTVYRAEQISLNREVALKVLSKRLTKNPVFVARFQAEAKAAARLHHPNVVQVFDVDHEADTYFYSMELMHRGSLEDLLRKHGKIEAEQATRMVSEAAQGLSYAESLGIVHRDIKPDNLMLDHHGHVKIADLGLAQSDDDDSGSLQGTPHFMSPEQALRRPLDHRSDLYALGCTFYRLVTGQNPFPKQSVKEILKAQVKELAVPANKLDPEVPAEISEVILQLMAKAPEDRYQSADDLVEDLEALLAPPTRKGLLYTVTSIALIGVIVAVVYVMNLPEAETRIVDRPLSDPHTAIAETRVRETAAENARLRLQLQDLQGEARVAALEAMAQQYVGTKAAEVALRDAANLRVASENSSAAARRWQQAVVAARLAIRSGFDAAMNNRDLKQASNTIDSANIPADLRNAAELEALIKGLRSRLQAEAKSRLRGLVTALEGARQAGDAANIQAAIGTAKAQLDPDKGWILQVLGEANELQQALDAASDTVVELVNTEAESREHLAWKALRMVMMSPGGVIEKIAALALVEASAELRRLAADHEGLAAADRAALLAQALATAEEFRRSFTTAVAQGEVTLLAEDGEIFGQILAIETGVGGLGIRVRPHRQRSGERFLTLAELTPRMQRVFHLEMIPDDALSRQAFLGVLALADGLRRAQQFLAVVDKTKIDAELAEFDARAFDLESLAQNLAGHDEASWATSLARELLACQQITAGLQAFSTGHLLSADRLVTAILDTDSDLLVVQSLL